ncbi:MAG: TraR/DksA family transcriptional regulator [Chitinophagaceae bacterium]|nr:TraR/DksA family transcriptional regulator [Chitinophagaceae bacterium]
MATKKKAPAKKAKPAAKPARPNGGKGVKPVKKAAPAKKPAAKKPVAKKPVAKKPVAKKPVTKKPVAKAKPAPKKVSKPVKKVVPAPKAVKKPAPKAVVKPVAKAVVKPVAKKVEVKPVAKVAPPKVSVPQRAKDIKIIPAKPVVLPKINTKTSRKYQPDFTKSVLDQPKNDPGAPIVRYSDSDLQEFRDLIQRKLESAKKELAYLQGLITRKDEMGGDNDDARYMTMEDGSMSMEREQLSQMASRQITFIDHLEKALMRIENKTYGICRVTGRLIDKARLRAVPHATLSIEAKMGAVK